MDSLLVSPSRMPPDSTPPRPPTPGLERISDFALLAMAAALGLVSLHLLRAPPPTPPAPFDWQNPLLFAQPGQCVEVGNTASPGDAAWLVAPAIQRAKGVVIGRDYPAPIVDHATARRAALALFAKARAA